MKKTLTATILSLIIVSIGIFVIKNTEVVSKNNQAAVVSGEVLGATTEGLVGHWKFDEGSGTTVADSSGNGNSGTINSLISVVGKIDSALNFTGSSYVEIPSNPVLKPTTAITLSAWVKPSNLNPINPIISFDAGSINAYELRWKDLGATSATGPTMLIRSGSTSYNVNFNLNPVSTNKWYLVTGSYDSSTGVISIYLDGVLKNSTTITPDSLITYGSFGTQKVNIAADAGTNNLKASVDDVRVYNRTLSAQEVLDIYNDVPAIVDGGDSGGGSQTLPSDTIPPEVTNINSAGITSSSATISWYTNEGSDSQVEYGLTSSYGLSSSLDSSLVSNHSVSLSDLEPDSIYHYRVKSKDSSGNTVTSANNTFITLSATQGTVEQITNLNCNIPTSSNYNSANFIIINNKSGQAQTNYPVQIARPFIQGDIANYPVVVLNGTPICTQADVKQRYSNGSVKHSIISFVIPSLPANQDVKIYFGNQSTGNNNPLSKTSMLGSNFDFEAKMDLVNGANTVSASARGMLQNGDYEYWTQGPVATSIILKDHSAARKYDIGFDSNKSFRPIFHATFWPSLDKVKVRYIGEIANTEVFQDMTYNLNLKNGLENPVSIYTKNNFTHAFASRWTKEFWIGGSVENKININHNLSYLKETLFFPNFDSSRPISESALVNEHNIWQSTAKDLGDVGNWQKAMPATGGRPDLGPYPQWTTLWLYTGDWRVKEKTFVNGDLAARWAMNFREGKAGKYFNKENTISALGRAVNLFSRPTMFNNDGNNQVVPNQSSYISAADKYVFVGPVSNNSYGWTHDTAHQPNAYMPQYVLSGDYWYLEQMYFWSSWNSLHGNPADTIYSARGPKSMGGFYPNTVRGVAWLLRSRSELAFVAPDNSPEKTYFTRITDDAMAKLEGLHDVAPSKPSNADYMIMWNWAQKWVSNSNASLNFYGNLQGPIGLNLYAYGSRDCRYAEVDFNKAGRAISPWQESFMMYAIGRVKEMGFGGNNFVSYLSKGHTMIMNHPNPKVRYLIAEYGLPVDTIATPTTSACGATTYQSWITNYDNIFDYYKPTFNSEASFNLRASLTVHADHYPFYAMGANSYITNEPGGSDAWAWISGIMLNKSVWSIDPRWLIVPRSITVIPPIIVPTTSTPPVTEALLPVISSIATPSVSTSTATITWNTDVDTDTQVEYGLTTNYGSSSVLKDSTTKVKTHSVTLTGLTPGVRYNFRVRSRDTDNNLALSINQSFTTSLVINDVVVVPSVPVVTQPSTPGGAVISQTANTKTTTTGSSDIRQTATTQTTTTQNTTSTNPNLKPIYQNLSRGSKHSEVTTVQQLLISESLLSGDSATGFFGPLTEEAVKAFQRKYNIVSSGSPSTTGYGVIGPKTRAKINELLGITTQTTTTTSTATPSNTSVKTKLTKPLSRGARGSDVTTLQNVLIKEGFLSSDSNTGYFGPLTEAAVKAFQKKYNIVISGTPTTTGFGSTGPKTRAKVNEIGGY